MFLLTLAIGKGYYLTESPRDDASATFALVRAHHGMRLPAASLPIGEDCPIVAFDDAINESECSLFVDIALKGIGVEDIIECE